MPKSATIHLKAGRDKPVHHRHPWIFSGAIARVEGNTRPGDIVRIQSATGEFLAWGYFNPQSQISLRLLSWNEGEDINDEWWAKALDAAISRRESLASSAETNAYRLVFSDADGLPGLIVDRYDKFLACQFLTVGIERVRELLIDALWNQLRPIGIVDQSDNDIRKTEGLSESGGLIRGESPADQIIVRENGFRYAVDLKLGQKTGFYLDQRRNRRVVARYAQGRRVLDCFCYSGGFTIPVLASAPSSVTGIDSSAPSLELLRSSLTLFSEDHPDAAANQVELIGANVFEVLRKFRDRARQFDMIILDPPKLAASQSQVARAMRAYKDLNLLAMKLLTAGGILATFSCSGSVSRVAFQETVAWAATDAKRRVQILEQLAQGEDHPVLVSFPESEYLKGLICRID